MQKRSATAAHDSDLVQCHGFDNASRPVYGYVRTADASRYKEDVLANL